MTISAAHAGPEEMTAEDLARRYDLIAHDIPVAGRIFRLLAVRDTNRLVDAIDPASFASDERLPYWADLWPSAITLAEWCLATTWHPGTEVLELGCGLGLVGIAAAAGGARVTMTDYEEDALHFAQCNARANLPADVVRDRLRFQLLDWRTPPAGATYDVILGADIVYERRFFVPLLKLFDQLLAPVGRVSDPTRGPAVQGPSGSLIDAFAVHPPIGYQLLNSDIRYQISDISSSQPHIVLTEPDRTVGREFFREARLAGFDVTTHNSAVYRNGRATGIVRAELRRREAPRNPEVTPSEAEGRALSSESKGERP